MASSSESIFVVSTSLVVLTESACNESAAATVSTADESATTVESFAPLPPLPRSKKGIPGSAIINMKADSRMNMTVFVLIAMQGANLRK